MIVAFNREQSTVATNFGLVIIGFAACSMLLLFLLSVLVPVVSRSLELVS
jgi:hypothetical protein